MSSCCRRNEELTKSYRKFEKHFGFYEEKKEKFFGKKLWTELKNSSRRNRSHDNHGQQKAHKKMVRKPIELRRWPKYHLRRETKKKLQTWTTTTCPTAVSLLLRINLIFPCHNWHGKIKLTRRSSDTMNAHCGFECFSNSDGQPVLSTSTKRWRRTYQYRRWGPDFSVKPTKSESELNNNGGDRKTEATHTCWIRLGKKRLGNKPRYLGRRNKNVPPCILGNYAYPLKPHKIPWEEYQHTRRPPGSLACLKFVRNAF